MKMWKCKLTQPKGFTMSRLCRSYFLLSSYTDTSTVRMKKYLNFSYKRHCSRAILVQKQFVKSHTRLLFVYSAILLRWENLQLIFIFQIFKVNVKWIWMPELHFESAEIFRNLFCERKYSDFSFNGYVSCESYVDWK